MLLADDNENKYRQVVILINKYNSPLLNIIGIMNKSIKIVSNSYVIIKSFFKVIKALQSKVKFLLVIGIIMFAHLGLFLELNNLKDIILSNKLFGTYSFTNDEITNVFENKLLDFCQLDCFSNMQDLMNNLQKKCNGYFWNGNIKVYNPYSICNFFESSEYENF